MAVDTTWLADDAAVQDADLWWSLIVGACGQALGSRRRQRVKVVAVSITGQWASTVPVDASGRPVGDCDVDGQGICATSVRSSAVKVAGYSPKKRGVVGRTGAAPSPQGSDPIGHMLLIERDFPEVARQVAWYLEPVDYLSCGFTGVASGVAGVDHRLLVARQPQLDRLSYDEDATVAAVVRRPVEAAAAPGGDRFGDGPVLDPRWRRSSTTAGRPAQVSRPTARRPPAPRRP